MGHPRKLTGVPLRQPARPFRRHNSQTRDIEGLDLAAFRPPSGSRRTSSSLGSAKPKICRSPILYAARLGNFSKVAPWAQLPTSRRHTASAPRCLWIGYISGFATLRNHCLRRHQIAPSKSDRDYGTGSAQTRRYAATDIGLGVDILFMLAALVSCVAVAGKLLSEGTATRVKRCSATRAVPSRKPADASRSRHQAQAALRKQRD